MSVTELDLAFLAMDKSPEDEATRLRFFERLADSELFLLLSREAEGDVIDPEVFEVEGERFVLVFDREERLTEFTGKVAPYAAVSGRTIAPMLAGQGIGLALNADVAPSSMLVPPDALGWLAGTLEQGPEEGEGRIAEIAPPRGLPEALVTGLDRKLATAAGLARSAYLAAVTYEDGRTGHLLAVIDAQSGAERALASAINEALTFSGIEAGSLDVAFLAASDSLAATLARHGLRFDLPSPEAGLAPLSPGTDPERPPKLR